MPSKGRPAASIATTVATPAQVEAAASWAVPVTVVLRVLLVFAIGAVISLVSAYLTGGLSTPAVAELAATASEADLLDLLELLEIAA